MTHFDYFFSTVEEIRKFVNSSESSKSQEGRNLSRYFNVLDNSSHLNPRELSSKEYQLRGILNEKAFWEFHLRYPGFRQLTYDSLGIDRTLLIIPQSRLLRKDGCPQRHPFFFVEISISAFSLPVVKITVNRDFNMDILYSLYDLCIFSHFYLVSPSNSVTI